MTSGTATACEDNPVDAKVEVRNATQTNDIGDAPLVAVGFHFNHSGLDSPQLAAFVIPAEAGIQFFMSGFPPTRE